MVCNSLGPMNRGRTARNSPNSPVLYIYEGATSINVIGAKTNMSTNIVFIWGHSSTYLVSVAVSTSGHHCFPTFSNTLRCSPYCSSSAHDRTKQIDELVKRAHSLATSRPNLSHTTSTDARCECRAGCTITPRLTAVKALFAFVIVTMSTLN